MIDCLLLRKKAKEVAAAIEHEKEAMDAQMVEIASAASLSYVGDAAYQVLRKKHGRRHHKSWNVTSSCVVGDVWNTPRDAFSRTDSVDPEVVPHDTWLPEKMGELIARTEEWCDIMSLSPPDGMFLQSFKDALKEICEREHVSLRKVTIRMMFGNIIGMPVHCNNFIEEVTKDLPPNAGERIHLWVGSWRKGVSWNHSKIIAVDGKYLWTGGHNLWTNHYLREDPVNDISMELEGPAANDAHLYANQQWGYIVRKQSTPWGRFVDKRIPDSWEIPRRHRVAVSEFPFSRAAEFPPLYERRQPLITRKQSSSHRIHCDDVPVITMGRYGVIVRRHRPADDALVAMFNAAKKVIRLAIQDLGPMVVPGTKVAAPGTKWPRKYLESLARALWARNVDVEIVLSNPNSMPGLLTSVTEFTYGNGWTCADLGYQIGKAILKQFPHASRVKLRHILRTKLRLCFVRSPKGGTKYESGRTLGLHSKYYMIDDMAYYIGSQNLYDCDLAEWGVVVDSEKEAQKVKAQYWDPMWKVSYVTRRKGGMCGDLGDHEVEQILSALEKNISSIVLSCRQCMAVTTTPCAKTDVVTAN